MKIYDVSFPIKVAQTASKVYSSFRITPTQHICAIAYKVTGTIATAVQTAGVVEYVRKLLRLGHVLLCFPGVDKGFIGWNNY